MGADGFWQEPSKFTVAENLEKKKTNLLI